ncbi:hypothetical protein NDU88_003263 [Pleurodeles waltl]|uniref:Uncharacterized protein n=1 Tax=Pleurodeles waltl TaxID=8319 RepID=A0AAV7LET3_PLEWA|nr:hypothetical protein NDU88_003263 [Pleurodeles waltl]
MNVISLSRCSRVPRGPATPADNHQGHEYPGDNPDGDPKGDAIGNPEIRVPVETKEGQLMRPREEEKRTDAENADRERHEPPSESNTGRHRGRGTLGRVYPDVAGCLAAQLRLLTTIRDMSTPGTTPTETRKETPSGTRKSGFP